VSASVVLSSLIAVVGTLSGGLLAGVVQGRVARAGRRETRCEVRRSEVLAAVTGLVSALADHRRAMWVLEDLRLAGADEQVVGQARATSHVTRSAVTAPLTTVSILAADLAPVATQAAQAAFALHAAPDPSTLADLRAAALQASDRLVEAAGVVLGRGAP
jgi:hypothetical protein